MPITVLADVIMPNSVLSSGVKGKNMRLNSRVGLNNGYESINVIWSRTLRQYEVGTVPMLVSQWQALEALHEITEGGAYGFLMQDPKDCEVSGGVVLAIEGGGYQLYKRYTDTGSGRTKDRIITRPMAQNLVVTSNGTPVSYVLDVTTGRLTVAGSPDPATLRWSGRFYVPVHFMEDAIDWELVAPGAASQRLLAGPSVILQEIRE